ncbi:MAG: MiaB/RimO family radical SAM methylthiotransferase, partial [Bacteroidetes bacterium]|nr:MiaB/RimO family radical SAM methylthiotransferase [Bacteroidota bacterium]
MKIHFINIGCKVNFVELSRLKEEFSRLNFEINDAIEGSDIILINTCSVTSKAEADSRKLIRRVRRINPDSFIGVLGCYAQLNPKEILEATDADAVFGINEKFNIPQIIKEKIEQKQNSSLCSVDSINNNFDYAYSGDNESRTRAIIKLQDGCNYKCTYCTIPLARGNSRSIEFEKILPQIEHIYNSGFKEIVLTGINLSDYNYDNKNFYDVLRLISSIDLPLRFRISSIEPNIIKTELLDIITNATNICPHFHIPLQSGCDDILKKMRRRYNTTQFRKYIELINSYMPNACIGLDVITGFPTENNYLFKETYDFINSLNITYIHCFSY